MSDMDLNINGCEEQVPFWDHEFEAVVTAVVLDTLPTGTMPAKFGGTMTSMSAVITGINDSDIRNLQPGMILDPTYFPTGTKIVTVDPDSGTVTASAASILPGTYDAIHALWYLYTWEEVSYGSDTTAACLEEGPRSGTYLLNPAVEINNTLIAVPTRVMMRYRSTAGGDPVFDFVGPMSNSGSGIFIDTPVTFGGSPVIFDDVSVQYIDDTTVFFDDTVIITIAGYILWESYPGPYPDDSLYLDPTTGRLTIKISGKAYPLGLSVDSTTVVIEPAGRTDGVDVLRFDSDYFVAFTDSGNANQADVTLVLEVQGATNNPNTGAGHSVKPWNLISFDSTYFQVWPETGDPLQADISLNLLVEEGTIAPAGAGPVEANEWLFDEIFFNVHKHTGSPNTADISLTLVVDDGVINPGAAGPVAASEWLFDNTYFVVHQHTGAANTADISLDITAKAGIYDPGLSGTVTFNELNFDGNFFEVAPDVAASHTADITLVITAQAAMNNPDTSTSILAGWNLISFDEDFFLVHPETADPLRVDVSIKPLQVDATNVPVLPNAVTNPTFAIRFESDIFIVFEDPVLSTQADITMAWPDSYILIGQGPSTPVRPKLPTGDISLASTGVFRTTGIQTVPVLSTPVSDAQILIFNVTSHQWEPKSVSQDLDLTNAGFGTVKGLYGVPLDGVTVPSPVAGDILQYNGTYWVALPFATAASTFLMSVSGFASTGSPQVFMNISGSFRWVTTSTCS